MGINIESKHSALKQKIGDPYHYLVALKYMLENSDWSYCDIEYSGDISLRDISNNMILNIEVKHHIDTVELKDNSVELWKTIHNFYNDSNKYVDETELVLYTVSTIEESNTLDKWNDKLPEEKLELLRKASLKNKTDIYVTLEDYYNVIFEDEEKLKGILSKFKLQANQKDYTQYREYLKSESYFKQFLEKEKKINAIDSLLSIILSGLKDETTWTISKDDFEKKLKEISGDAQDLVVRVDDDVDISIDEEEYKSRKFVEKLNDIELDDVVIEYAIEDYAKTIYEVDKRMSFVSEFDYQKKLDSYEKTLVKNYRLTKNKITVNKDTIIDQSKQFYHQVQGLPKIPFIGKSIDDKTTFFQNGYYHILADNDEEEKKRIYWHLEKK